MGNQKQKWTAEEEGALLAGIAKHGQGKWKNILKDTEFAHSLIHRSNIDLKDKWRNLSGSTSDVQGSKEKLKASKVKFAVAAQNAIVLSSLSDAVMDDDSNSAPVFKNASQNAPRYNAMPADRSNHTSMIFEAISTMKDMNGSDIGAILNFIERMREVPLPPTFRKTMSTRLRKLVSQGKLEKVENRYKIKEDTTLGTNTPTPTPEQEDVRQQELQNSECMTSTETVQDAADTAASKLAEAEFKYFLAAEAMKEAERVSKMAEDTESMLQLMKEIYEQCSRGEVVAVA